MTRIFVLILILMVTKPLASHAQTPVIDVIKAGIAKVVKAVDLKIQRLQNETIWMQNAQKKIENTLTKLKLEEIAGWMEQQKKLYDTYYQELWNIKQTVATYHRIASIYQKQQKILKTYGNGLKMIAGSKQFNAAEKQHMLKVYSGILSDGQHCTELVTLVLRGGQMQMTDEERLQVVDLSANEMDNLLSNILDFSFSNQMVHLQRERDGREKDSWK